MSKSNATSLSQSDVFLSKDDINKIVSIAHRCQTLIESGCCTPNQSQYYLGYLIAFCSPGGYSFGVPNCYEHDAGPDGIAYVIDSGPLAKARDFWAELLRDVTIYIENRLPLSLDENLLFLILGSRALQQPYVPDYVMGVLHEDVL